jgi:hypothetical protein
MGVFTARRALQSRVASFGRTRAASAHARSYSTLLYFLAGSRFKATLATQSKGGNGVRSIASAARERTKNEESFTNQGRTPS